MAPATEGVPLEVVVVVEAAVVVANTNTHTEEPNFSIISPGGCNAICSFCTDPMNYKYNHQTYISKLAIALLEKDPKFNRVSITGGEPTLSKLLTEILQLSRHFFDKVVFTTNDTRLRLHQKLIADHIDHLNVSRHAIGYEDNTKVFHTKQIINDEDLKETIKFFLSRGVDVNINHVYGPQDSFVTEDYVRRFIQYCHQLGATSISFRYDQNFNNLGHTEIEKVFLAQYPIVRKGSCAVCRNFSMIIDDMTVVWKSSFANPEEHMNGEIYEYVFHTDGELRTGWVNPNLRNLE